MVVSSPARSVSKIDNRRNAINSGTGIQTTAGKPSFSKTQYPEAIAADLGIKFKGEQDGIFVFQDDATVSFSVDDLTDAQYVYAEKLDDNVAGGKNEES